jgi:hypothetical protein
MLQTVDVGQRSIDSYQQIAPVATLEELRQVAKDLQGARILQLNATPYGGGVSELLRSSVPLLNSLGLVADWKIISGDDAFFQVTETIHNGLQGAPQQLTERDRATYRRTAERNARLLEEQYDFWSARWHRTTRRAGRCTGRSVRLGRPTQGSTCSPTSPVSATSRSTRSSACRPWW